MRAKINQIILATLCYVLVCFFVSALIIPFTITNFIGPAAAIMSALVMLWGSHVLLSVVVGAFIFNVISTSYLGVSIDIAILLITMLAISLQAYFCMQLTSTELATQQWLESRAQLLVFIFKIGPVVGCISAFTAVLITVLDVKSFEVSLIYAFANAWSASILASVFLIPIVLLMQKRQKINITKRTLVVVSSILGCVALVLLIRISQHQQQHNRYDDFEQSRAEIIAHIDNEIELITHQLTALAGFFKASEHIYFSEFIEFTTHIYDSSSSVKTLEWLAVVSKDNRGLFEQNNSNSMGSTVRIKEQNFDGTFISAQERPFFIPVQYIFPFFKNDVSLGVDRFTNLNDQRAMKEASQRKRIVSSEPQLLIQKDQSSAGVRVFYPIISSINVSSGAGDYGIANIVPQTPVKGFVMATLSFDRFFKKINHLQKNRNISAFAQYIGLNNLYTINGDEISRENRLVDEVTISAFSQQWQILITEKSPWTIQDKSWQTWVMLIGGTLGGVLFQFLILMMTAYSTELGYQINQKTKELMIAKERSDRENQAKSHFLKGISDELSTPIQVIRRLAEAFPDQNLSSQARHCISMITDASLNLEQIVDSMMELSKIESKNLLFNQQSFDLLSLLNRLEAMFSASKRTQGKVIKLVVNKNVPIYIESDELRLQQLIIVLAENAEEILSCAGICIAVKAHFHNQDHATIFFVVTPVENQIIENDSSENEENSLQKLNANNIRMAMVKELCHLFDGDIKITQLPSGMTMLTLAIKVPLGNIKTDDFSRYFISSNKNLSEANTSKHVLLIEGGTSKEDHIFQLLLSLGYQVEVVASHHDNLANVDTLPSQIIIIDCQANQFFSSPVLKKYAKKQKAFSIPVIGIFNGPLNEEQKHSVNKHFSDFLVMPVYRERLQIVIEKCIKQLAN